MIIAGIIIYFRGKGGNSASPRRPWSWPLDPFPQLQNQGTGDTLRARSGAGPPHSGCSNHYSGDDTGQPSDAVREWGVMKKGNAPRRSAPTKHATLQRARGTKNSRPGRGRVAAGSEGTAGFLGVLTVRGRLYGRWLPMTASLSHMEEELARRVRGRPEGGRGEPSHDRKQEVQS